MFFEVVYKGTRKKMIVNVKKIDIVTECQEYGRKISNAVIQVNGCPYEVKETYEEVKDLINKAMQ